MKRPTDLIHHPYQAPSEFAAPQPGVFKASTVIFPDVASIAQRDWMQKNGYTYGLHGTPTTFTLEERLATLEGGTHCLLVPSGLAAIAHINLALLSQGDEVLLPDNAYGPNKALAANELQRWGIATQHYDPMSVDDLAARLSARTKLVWLEAPGSVTMEFPDLLAMVRLCRERDVLCALDNTWGAGLAFNAFDLLPDQPGVLGVDLTAHALTKYPSGGGDVLMGSIVTRRDDLAQSLKLTHMRLGTGVGANDVELLLRSLPSMDLRYRAQDKAARELARWCAQQAAVAQVLHPALPDAPGHAHWQRVCVSSQAPQGLAAGIFSIVLDARFTPQQVHAFCDGLQLFKLGYSWGGPISLVMTYQRQAIRRLPTPHLREGHLVRLCVGLEDVADLCADLQQSMAQHLAC
jgi:cystathionine beta-lyase